MNPFQQSCAGTLRSLYEDYRISPETEAVETRESELMQSRRGDVYLHHVFEHKGHTFEVFVYVDKAGFFVDRSWHGFEREDYATEEDIIAALGSDLRSLLNC